MGLSISILKLGLTRTFDWTVNGYTENSKCIEFTMYLLSFFVEIKKRVLIKFAVCKAQFRLFNNDAVWPNTHIYEQFRLFSSEAKIWAGIQKIHIYADHVRSG